MLEYKPGEGVVWAEKRFMTGLGIAPASSGSVGVSILAPVSGNGNTINGGATATSTASASPAVSIPSGVPGLGQGGMNPAASTVAPTTASNGPAKNPNQMLLIVGIVAAGFLLISELGKKG